MLETIIIFGIGLLTIWSLIIFIQTLQIIKSAIIIRGKVRLMDKIILGTSLMLFGINSWLFVSHPEIIHSHASSTTCIELGLSFLMFYLHELQIKNWKRFKKSLSNLTS